MATKLVKCSRVVTYLPSLQSAVIRCRTLSSSSSAAADTSGLQVSESAIESAKTLIVCADKLLCPINPQDKRFPLPGGTALCTTSRLNSDININSFNSSVFDSDILLPSLPFLKHNDADYFLTSFNEVDVNFIDMSVSFPLPSDKMEYRAHSCPVLLRKGCSMEGDLTIVTISLKTQNDMTLWSQQVEQEREELLEAFIQGALEICQMFEKSGYWADFIDPSSGKPFKGSHTNFTLFETDERYRKLGFEIQDLGCCKVISHPVWGAHAYIGCLFTSAPIDHSLIVNLHESQ
ncbi:unnamed protein product [Candidula unifasciata]|uniref:Methylmalonic aciduria and homocystinuria type D protein n=1 Tax=Candidula unifasciata TaxID=100452 RepID=A0A8S3Z9A0_9EUPU|nr:unnamed protein product [Candidula unifasciata]